MTETPQAEQANPDPKDASRSRSLAAKASALMAAGTIVSRVLGFVRTSLLAVAIGSTALVADVFETANTIPNVIYMLLAGGVFNVVLVPQIIKQAKKADRGADYTSRLITLAALLIGAFTIAITLLAAPIIDGLTLNWAGPKLALGTAFALWTLPQIFFYGMYAVIGQVLNAHGRFGAYMWAPVANNIIAIGFILFYIVMFGPYVVMPDTQQFSEWTTTHTIVLAGGHTLGILVQAVVLLWPLKRLGLGLKPKFGWKGMGLRHTGRLAGFTIVTMMVGNISNLMINRLVTGATEARSQLDDPFEQAAIPGLQALNIGQLITVLPHSVFVLSIATVLFNHLARSMQDEDLETARRTTGSGLRTFAVPMMISVVGIIVLAPTVARLFASTADTAIVSAHAIAQILLILALGMPLRSAHFYLLRVFYAAENAMIPMIVQVGAAALSLSLAYGIAPLVPPETLAHLIALVFTVVHVFQLALTHMLVKRVYGDYGVKAVISTYVRTGWAAIAAGIFGAALLYPLGGYTGGWAMSSIPNAVIACGLVGTVMVAVYLVACRIFDVTELQQFLNPITNRLKRKTNTE
ncbi:MAG: murein biosynthesis protein MurJ [Yaniella sp.]|uniref:murein biosynthesis integral membrane protein MurJ n=1 Tax=Yaniella sp. TaxID=2773929 RepID=UPI002648F409|nr:lipid II flippase MurJ [Yaniella sp.]MDN5890225.1 murein biosynthesis protein MurJ [Yaniella sp.]MDN6151205.1 murein biosynthesis protein MurJ [Yaniella sp.]MDN6490415.1 murein biosynthesis protein MurJ [Yaniella sp.]MDN6498850.1 murein biosynthesis protein MurJ [Yaniella sp.]MDN6757917.1 murein biosynthesis protein MurJ [Yaniella sp.]